MIPQPLHPETVTIIVPTLNEVENIDPLLARIFAQCSWGFSLNIIFVDDGSTDGTREKIAEWASRRPVQLLARSAPGDGLSGAVFAGVRLASSSLIVVMDADLSHPPEQIPALLGPLLAEQCDMVIGSRYIPGGTTPGWPLFRRLLSRGAALLAWPLTGLRDATSGFFAVRREWLAGLDGQLAGGFKIGLEILLRNAEAQLRVREVPITFRDRERGRSKMNARVGLIYVRQLLGFVAGKIQSVPARRALVPGLWALALAIICTRAIIEPHKNTVFATYDLAGLHWRRGEEIYARTGGFVYGPIMAAAFAPFSLLPSWLANVGWRLLDAGIFVAGVSWWLRRGLTPDIPRARWGMVFLAFLPLALGNFNNGQVNPIVVGLLMIAILGVDSARWWLAAFAIAVASYLKIYPLVAGLLLVTMFPRPFAWRLGVALAGLGALPFLLQSPAYAAAQYHAWWTTRLADNRHLYELAVAPRDLWRLLREWHVAISPFAYKILQVGTAALLALYAASGPWRRQPATARLGSVFAFACCWMLLLGPATESATYVILAPAVVFAVARELSRDHRPELGQRILLLGSLALLAGALAINSFTHANRDPRLMVLQPLGAALFTVSRLVALRPKPAVASAPAPWARPQQAGEAVKAK